MTDLSGEARGIVEFDIASDGRVIIDGKPTEHDYGETARDLDFPGIWYWLEDDPSAVINKISDTEGITIPVDDERIASLSSLAGFVIWIGAK